MQPDEQLASLQNKMPSLVGSIFGLRPAFHTRSQGPCSTQISEVKVPTWVLVHPGPPSATCHGKAFIQILAAYKLQQLLYPPGFTLIINDHGIGL